MSLITLRLRKPTTIDGYAVWRFIQGAPPLEPNTCYAYVLLCTHFRETCVLAEDGDGVQGFVAGYVLPDRPDTVFVWQIGVGEAARGQGLGRQMLDELIARDACSDVRYLETTVTPSNRASRAMFESFARHRGAACEAQEFFREDLFGTEAHEAEDLLRIGPLES